MKSLEFFLLFLPGLFREKNDFPLLKTHFNKTFPKFHLHMSSFMAHGIPYVHNKNLLEFLLTYWSFNTFLFMIKLPQVLNLSQFSGILAGSG